MFAWFGTVSLRWKLASVTVLTTTVALVLAGLIMASYDARTYESQKTGEVKSAAEILAASVSAAVTFDDAAAAKEYLQALEVNREIVSAGVYSGDGNLLSSYRRDGTDDQEAPESAGEIGSRF